jgi:hypothetical protein
MKYNVNEKFVTTKLQMKYDNFENKMQEIYLAI